MGLVAVDIAEDVAAAVEIDQRADRRAFDRLHDLDGDGPVRTRDAGSFELARRQLRLGIEKRANIARPLAADWTVASRVQIGDAGFLPFALYLNEGRIEWLFLCGHRFLPQFAGSTSVRSITTDWPIGGVLMVFEAK